jgi:menaquinone-dependent protoporphyrinogen oxidase
MADTIARALAARGLDAEAVLPEVVDAVDGYDAFVLGSAVYFGHWLDPAINLVEEHMETLAARPVWLFSSGPLGPPGDELPEGDAVDAAPMIEKTRALAHRTFAGRLDRSLLGFREKAVVVALRAPEGDFRDWAAIDAFANEIADHLTERSG